MDKTPAYYIFLGLLIGAVFGLGIGAVGGNTINGMEVGALAGVFIGWFLAAAAFENRSKKN
jgi:uncharacterized protein YcfJ